MEICEKTFVAMSAQIRLSVRPFLKFLSVSVSLVLKILFCLSDVFIRIFQLLVFGRVIFFFSLSFLIGFLVSPDCLRKCFSLTIQMCVFTFQLIAEFGVESLRLRLKRGKKDEHDLAVFEEWKIAGFFFKWSDFVFVIFSFFIFLFSTLC